MRRSSRSRRKCATGSRHVGRDPVAEESRRSRSSHVSKERLLQWQKKLAGKGWLAPNWPKEYGGTGWNSTQKFIFEMEMARADSPYLSSFSIKMVAPVLMKFGSD